MSSVNFTENDYKLTDTSSVNAKRAIQGKGADQLTMDDFFNLFVAQMTNQDMLNPQDNTEFVAQMAQFTSLQGIKQIQEYQLSSYAVSYVGKDVTIAQINEYTGEMEKITGKVEGVTFYDGAPQVVVGDKTYPLYTIMEVNAAGSSSGNSSSGSLSEVAHYVGKNVRILHENEFGTPETINGIVEKVTLIDGKPYVVVNGVEYPASEIQSIISDETISRDEALDEARQYFEKFVNVRVEDINGNVSTIIGQVANLKYTDGQAYLLIDSDDGMDYYPISAVQSILSADEVAEMQNRALEEATARYMGETVSIVQTHEDGSTTRITGVVSNVKLIAGKPCVTVDGVDYSTKLIQ